MLRVRVFAFSVCSVFWLASCSSLGEKAAPPHPTKSEKPRALDAGAMYRLGRYYQGQTRYVEAALAYRRALQLDPRFADAHNGLGVSYAEQGSYREAVEALRTAVALRPDAAYLHGNLGYALLLIGSDEEALDVLGRARTLDPTNENVLRNLDLAQQRAGRSNEHVTDGPVAAPENAREDQGSDVKLVSIAPHVYELQTSAAMATGEEAFPAMESKSAVAKAQGYEVSEATGDATTLPEPHAARQLFRLEVSNGSGISGLAKRVARFFDKHGIHASRVTNRKGFAQGRTVVQFRPGYSSNANDVRAMLPQATVPIVQSSALPSDIDVRVVLGPDLRTETALVPPDAPWSPGSSSIASSGLALQPPLSRYLVSNRPNRI